MFVLYVLQSPSSERSQNGSSSDLRKRESRNSKPGSPSLHDPYTLFKFDKVTVLTDVLLNIYLYATSIGDFLPPQLYNHIERFQYLLHQGTGKAQASLRI